MKKQIKMTYREERRQLAKEALPHVRVLVKKFDITAVKNAIKVLDDERAAQKELLAAEKRIAELRKRLG